MTPNARRRKIISRVFEVLCAGAVLVALVPLGLILFYVVKEGFGALNWAFFTQMPKPVGEVGGGMANAIVGTLILVGLAALFAVPIGCICGIHLAEYPGSKFSSIVRFAADVLNGVPSIVIGVFVYGIAVLPFKQFSALAGGFALGIMMIPIIARTTEELLLLVPGTMREGALALGATRRSPVARSRRSRSRPTGVASRVRTTRTLTSSRPGSFRPFGPQRHADGTVATLPRPRKVQKPRTRQPSPQAGRSG
jgi:phosphate transport system permease protein